MDELKAGRDLDARVAEKVMGWYRVEASRRVILKTPDRTRGVTRWNDGKKWEGDALPKFSTDIAAAFEVATKLGLSIVPYGKGNDIKTWHAADGKVIAYGDTAPLAICLAALEAVEVK